MRYGRRSGYPGYTPPKKRVARGYVCDCGARIATSHGLREHRKNCMHARAVERENAPT